MNGGSKILVAHATAIGLSAIIFAPAEAQPSSLAPGTQPGGYVGHSKTGSNTAERLPEAPTTSPNPALGGQSASPITVITRALLPGHWALHGSNYVWVPPETTLREVRAAALVLGRYIWRNGSYVWMPQYYVKP